jgi:hypothetical protein
MKKELDPFIPVATILSYERNPKDVGHENLIEKINTFKTTKLNISGQWTLTTSWRHGFDPKDYILQIMDGSSLYDLIVQICNKFRQAYGGPCERIPDAIVDMESMAMRPNGVKDSPFNRRLVSTPWLEGIYLDANTKTITYFMGT